MRKDRLKEIKEERGSRAERALAFLAEKHAHVTKAVQDFGDEKEADRDRKVREKWMSRWMERTREIGRPCAGWEDIAMDD